MIVITRGAYTRIRTHAYTHVRAYISQAYIIKRRFLCKLYEFYLPYYPRRVLRRFFPSVRLRAGAMRQFARRARFVSSPWCCYANRARTMPNARRRRCRRKAVTNKKRNQRKTTVNKTAVFSLPLKSKSRPHTGAADFLYFRNFS